MALIARDIEFGYDKKIPILHGVSIQAEPGQMISLIGPNGSGKTTFIKCLNRIHRASGGTLTLDGKDLFSCKRESLAKKIGYVPQSLGNMMGGTVLDVIIIGRRQSITWKITEEDIGKAREILRPLGSEHLANQSYQELSGGQKQQVLIARALAQDTDIYLFDEPTSYLDIRNQLEVMKIARHLVEDLGRTVIMVVHDLNMAMRYSDRVVLMQNGRIFASGTPKEVLSEDNIWEVYGIRVEIIKEKYISPC